jgi:hypothetical protein
VAQQNKPTVKPIVLGEGPGDRADASGPGAAHVSGPNSGNPDSTACYVLRDEALIEDFENGSLVLLCEQLHFVQINSVARDVVAQLDGQRTVRQVSTAIAKSYDQPLEPVLADVLDLLAYLESQGVVQRSPAGRAGALSDYPSTSSG